MLSKFRKAVEDLKVGDGEKAGTTIGPIINSRWLSTTTSFTTLYDEHHESSNLIEIILNNGRQLERVDRIVKESVAAGAKVEVWQCPLSIDNTYDERDCVDDVSQFHMALVVVK